MRPTRLARTAAVTSILALSPLALAVTPVFAAIPAGDASHGICADASSGARVAKGATAKEPALYSPNDAKKYGTIPNLPTLPLGSVHIETVFHVITAADPTSAQQTRLQTMVDDQMDVLNAAYAGETSAIAADTPFRFDLTDTNFVTSAAWANVAPGKVEKDMKTALHVGDSETLNVYAAD
ncbi:MAG: hypothetical protein ABIR39_20150, partial [Nocardioides sp.]